MNIGGVSPLIVSIKLLNDQRINFSLFSHALTETWSSSSGFRKETQCHLIAYATTYFFSLYASTKEEWENNK